MLLKNLTEMFANSVQTDLSIAGDNICLLKQGCYTLIEKCLYNT